MHLGDRQNTNRPPSTPGQALGENTAQEESPLSVAELSQISACTGTPAPPPLGSHGAAAWEQVIQAPNLQPQYLPWTYNGGNKLHWTWHFPVPYLAAEGACSRWVGV